MSFDQFFVYMLVSVFCFVAWFWMATKIGLYVQYRYNRWVIWRLKTRIEKARSERQGLS